MKHLFLCIVSIAHAQPEVLHNDLQQEKDLVKYVSTIIEQNQPSGSNPVGADSIQGNCFFEGGSCNGAEFFLSDEKGNRLAIQRVMSSNTPAFSFSNLSTEKTYTLTIDHNRYHAKGERKGVKTGTLLFIEISKQAR